MNIVVLVAGVHDPKWPVEPDSAADETAPAEHRIMSPFDEGALEMALRVRDANPATQIKVHVAGGAAGMRVARAIAALNITDVATLALDRPWDQAATARTLAPLCDGADLILIGREFGDFDDGLVPALLARLLAVPFFGRAQTIGAQKDIILMREAGAYGETLAVSGRLLASVTNDRRTRLRKPLMKNVMMARQAVIGESPAANAPTAGLAVESLALRCSGRVRTDCAMISGPPERQAQVLATMLWEARA
jgi:electron transfer flavoprotein beta subunit